MQYTFKVTNTVCFPPELWRNRWYYERRMREEFQRSSIDNRLVIRPWFDTTRYSDIESKFTYIRMEAPAREF